jgi:hypothetical protein
MLVKLFTEHPRTVGESYFQHLGQATVFGLRMLGGGIACLLHGFFPFMFVRTGSSCIQHLHDRMVTNRARKYVEPQAAQLSR